MPKKVEGLEKLLVEDLQDLMDAEKQLVRALPKMAKSATDEGLAGALREHLEVTKGQVRRLEEVFQSMDMRPRSHPCRGMKGIVEEGQEILSREDEPGILDSAIAGSARKVEHYEMAGYESARSVAQQLGMKQAADLLQQTLKEEIETDKRLAQISKMLVKGAQASRGQQTKVEESRTARGGARSSSAGSRRTGRTERSAHPLIDHEEIQRWAEERDAHPACVRRTGGQGDVGMIRLDFPGYSGAESLEPISWDEWFQKFDEKNLALMVQDKTARGERSNFNKLVSRESVQGSPKTRAAG